MTGKHSEEIRWDSGKTNRFYYIVWTWMHYFQHITSWNCWKDLISKVGTYLSRKSYPLQAPLFLTIVKCVLSSLHVAKLGVWMDKWRKYWKFMGLSLALASLMLLSLHTLKCCLSYSTNSVYTSFHVHHRFIGLAVVSSSEGVMPTMQLFDVC